MGVESTRMLEAVASRLFGDDADTKPVALGRYAILERLGQGGMGSVYRAYDPELRREVALKVVEDTAPEGSQRDDMRERTLREAQMLARVSHPNVVAVHDVGVSRSGVFLAMELVVGSDLGRWLQEHPPGTRRRTVQALAFVQQAVEGLAAAHAASVIHRDIKPANILLGSDGRVRVADFGLARHDLDLPSQEGSSSSAVTETSVTRTGAVLGTPAYMPLEQLRGQPADRRSDTFSMCATAYEVLCGERPYAARTIDGLIAELERERPRPMAASAKVPRAIERVLARGLAASPRQRWATMAELGAALRKAQRGRRRWLVGAATLAGAGAIAIATQLPDGDTAYDRCADQASRAATLVEAGAGDRLRAHFEDAMGSHAAIGREVHERTAAALDRHAGEWGEAFEHTCRARWLDATASPARFDATVRCLERNLDVTDHLLATLADAPREVVSRAPASALALERPATCHEPEPAGVIAPEDPEARERWEAHRAALDHVRTSITLDDYAAASTLVKSTLAAVREAGSLALEARALLLQGEIEDRTGSPEEALRLTDEALWKAVTAGDDETFAAATIRTSYIVGVELGRFDEALRWSDRAQAVVSRLPDPDRTERERRFYRAAILGVSGRNDEAEAILAVLVEEEADTEGAERLRLASILRDYGGILGDRGEYDEADRMLRQALEIEIEIAGPWTQDASQVLISIGGNMLPQAKYAEAEKLFAEALEIRRAVVGPDSISTSEALQHLAIVSHLQRRNEDAEKFGREAHRIAVAMLGADNPRSVAYGLDVVNALLGQERFAEAVEQVEPLVAAGAAAFGADSITFASLLGGRARAYAGVDRLDDAVADLEAAIAVRRDKLGPKHPDLAKSLTTLGDVEIRRGRQPRALEVLTEAHAINLAKHGPAHPATRHSAEVLEQARTMRAGRGGSG